VQRNDCSKRVPMTGPLHQPAAAKLRLVAAGSIAVAIAVTGFKFAAYWRSGSAALYSDAIESIVNMLTALVALGAIHWALQPADRRHQFGHHKAEYFSAVIEGVLVLAAAFLILHEAWDAFFRPRQLSDLAAGMGLNAVAAALNAGWSVFLIAWGRRQRSPALIADGWHLGTDVATSVGVLLGLGLAALTGWQILDPALAALMALHIVWAGWRLVRASVGGLMDEAVNAEVGRQIRAVIVSNAAGAIEVHDVRTRTAASVVFIEFHLVVPGSMTVAASHQICDRLEALMRRAGPEARRGTRRKPREGLAHGVDFQPFSTRVGIRPGKNVDAFCARVYSPTDVWSIMQGSASPRRASGSSLRAVEAALSLVRPGEGTPRQAGVRAEASNRWIGRWRSRGAGQVRRLHSPSSPQASSTSRLAIICSRRSSSGAMSPGPAGAATLWARAGCIWPRLSSNRSICRAAPSRTRSASTRRPARRCVWRCCRATP
jgi:cation diffusion facilitator family transporter